MNMAKIETESKPGAGRLFDAFETHLEALKLWAALDDKCQGIVLDHLRCGLARRHSAGRASA